MTITKLDKGNLNFFVACFERKMAKNMFFCDFLKNGDFW